ncbi:ATP synthase F1 subunit epsilon [Pirellulaceae bacterium]|jgi:F-type H+-transporting ATPase subunit epsilon|nr:ATP synthase F1 subunit epsilon [Pirellulaceae bacterium]MDB4640149.1 ATP synthase F1 subunit epsilon [Pirellulaceae bacterium]
MAGKIHCVLVTPEKTTFDAAADFVVVPMIDGEAGIGVDHAPMIGRLGCGEVRIKVDGKGERFFVDGGFVQVDQNEVSVITGNAMLASDISVADVEASLHAAESVKPETTEEKLAKVRTITQSKAMLKVASKNK